MPSESPRADRIMQLASGYGPPLVIEAAVRRGVFDSLRDGPLTVQETAAATGASTRGLRAIMNALVGLELLAKDAQGQYALTPESAEFLVSGKPGFVGGILRHISTQLVPKWLQLGDVVATGTPAMAVNQQETGAAFFETFVEDLFPTNYPSACALAESLGVAEAKQTIQALDLAAGSGVWSIALAEKSPQVRATAVDWPNVLEVARRVTARRGVEQQFQFIAGDLLEVDFGGGYNIALLGHILHSEGESRSRRLLAKTADALASGGTIAIAEWLVNEDRTGPIRGLLFAVNMLVHTEEGDTFSFAEIAAWLQEAGFVGARQLDVEGGSQLILADKP